MSIGANWLAMARASRNLGRPGIVAMAMSAIDVALWDLKAALLDIALVDLIGATRPGIEVYGSGGFTSYDSSRLKNQLAGWVDRGIKKVKIKIGRNPETDISRVKEARDAIGDRAELFVDANGAYTRKPALSFGRAFSHSGVAWFEEPVSSDDVEGLRLPRDAAPAGMAIAAGEYGYNPAYFERMLLRGAVDVVQADATRCAGITGFLGVATLCEARSMPLSAHCCLSIHASPCCAARSAVHLEYFHDHVRIERMLFDGALEPQQAMLIPDRTRVGLGLEFKHADARRFEI